MIAIHHIINVKGHRLELANWAALNDLQKITEECSCARKHLVAF